MTMFPGEVDNRAEINPAILSANGYLILSLFAKRFHLCTCTE